MVKKFLTLRSFKKDTETPKAFPVSNGVNFHFSKQNLDRWDTILERAFEILPGLTSWSILIGMCWISFSQPLTAAVLVIAFDFYWFLRLFYMTLFLVLAYLRLSSEDETDWMERIHEIDRMSSPNAFGNDMRKTLKQKISDWVHKCKLKELHQTGELPPKSSQIHQLVIFSVAKESPQILEAGILSLSDQEFPPKKIVCVIAIEERADVQIKVGIAGLQKKYCHHFFDFLIFEHPDGLPGEAKVKGANVTYAAKGAAQYLQAKSIPFEDVIVSCFDADTVVGSNYFSCLTYHYLIYSGRNQASFQPIPVYHNNIWEASAFARVLDIGSSFFQLIEATDSDKLVTFSSHSMSFKALVDVGYWPVDMISDDSAIFWKALIHFDGKYRVIPMYVTISMDVVSGESWWKTITNIYRQKRRWAWGVENFPIVMRGFLHNGKIPLFDKIKYGFKLFEDHVAWATWAFLLTIIGWLPAFFTGQEFSNSVLYYSAPRITSTIFNLASLALITTIILSLFLLPKRKTKFDLMKRIILTIEWLFVPIVIVFLSALPALDAQTRLMMGKYMEFWVTEKTRKKVNLHDLKYTGL